MANSESAGEASGGGDGITVNVKFGGGTIPVEVLPDCLIKDLKAKLQPVTNVLIRGQKLISKGKVLQDGASLRDSGIKNGDKIMLMASKGLHQGDGPIMKNAATRPIPRNYGNDKAVEVKVEKSRVDHWKRMGVISLPSSNLKAIPEEVWACGSSVRLMDLHDNSIRDVPSQIASLTSLGRLDLNNNDIVDESMSWEGLVQLKKSLTYLFLRQNQLTKLPPAMGFLTSLLQLDIAHNKLTVLPAEIGNLTELKTLNVSSNRISSIDSLIGNCSNLFELDMSSNLLPELPPSMCNLKNLRELYLANNGLKALPSELFQKCSNLRKVDLHNTELTMKMLREMEGWDEFDKRRITKLQTQLDFKSLNSTDFDEGADIC